jgi:hypothetical protein
VLLVASDWESINGMEDSILASNLDPMRNPDTGKLGYFALSKIIVLAPKVK